MSSELKENLVDRNPDKLIRYLNKAVIVCVKILAVLMVVVIWISLINVIIHLGKEFIVPPYALFTAESLLSILGDFLAVLIAIEIFLNIVFYLKRDAVHVPLVLATALTAVARKVIILDYLAASSQHIYATAAVIFAVGVTYWLITKKDGSNPETEI